MSLTCLENIVGLSETACNCWDAEKPVDFDALNASSSGLYVAAADTIPLKWANSSADCENGGLWDMTIKARKEGIRNIFDGFLMATQKVKTNQFLPFTKIGDDYKTAAELVKGSVAAFWIEPYRIKGGKIQIAGVDLAFWDGIAGSTDVTIEVYSSLDLSTIITGGTGVATITANKTFATANFATPIVINLTDIRDDLNERLYFVYTIPVGARPVNNAIRIGCDCGDSYERNPWMQVSCGYGGIQADSVADLESPVSSGSNMQGMVINASFECDYYSWLCDLAQNPNELYLTGTGERLPLGMALADGIRAASVVSLCNSILNGTRINIYSMIQDVKKIYAIRGHYDKIAKMAIKNLVYYMPSDVSGCLVCAENSLLTKAPILV